MTKLVQQAVVRTNATPGSVCKIHMRAITFAELWSNYVKGDPYRDPKTGEVPEGFSNQCALRMSATFHRVGVEMKSFTSANVDLKPGTKTIGRVLLNGMFAATRANELASWLRRQPFCGLPRTPDDITGRDWEAKVVKRTGIIFFGDYWTRKGEATPSGGHIDLWNGSRLTNNGALGALETFSRFTLGIQDPWLPVYSDLRDSKIILFFPVQ
jgi:hypothetical protein